MEEARRDPGVDAALVDADRQVALERDALAGGVARRLFFVFFVLCVGGWVRVAQQFVVEGAGSATQKNKKTAAGEATNTHNTAHNKKRTRSSWRCRCHCSQ